MERSLWLKAAGGKIMHESEIEGAAMSEDNYLKIIIGVSSAFAGWLLAQMTSGAKAWLVRRKIKKILLEELSDLDKQIDRLFFFYARQLEIYGAHGIGNQTAASLSNPVFKGYYKEALLSLNQNQRISYQLIHSLVDLINLGICNFREMTSDIYAKHSINGAGEDLKKVGERWGRMAKAQFLSCAALQWQIRFHLLRKHNPDLSPYTEDHERYLRYLKSAQNNADKYIANGKTIDVDKFNEIYDPTAFSRDTVSP